MAALAPFRALRPAPSAAARVAAVPYDVVNADEARTLADGNPLSFLHVVRSDIDLPEDTDPHDEAVYARAKANLEQLMRQGTLMQEAAPSLYLYELTAGRMLVTSRRRLVNQPRAAL